jgi:hypothetical protein
MVEHRTTALKASGSHEPSGSVKRRGSLKVRATDPGSATLATGDLTDTEATIRHQIVDAIVAYRRKTGHCADTWSLPKSRQIVILELLHRATREDRRMSDAELAKAHDIRAGAFGIAIPAK